LTRFSKNQISGSFQQNPPTADTGSLPTSGRSAGREVAFAAVTKDFRARLANHVRGIEKFGLKAHANERHFASLWGMVRHINGLLTYAVAVEGADTFGPLTARFETALSREGWPNLTEASI
jgi:hypothetical protein